MYFSKGLKSKSRWRLLWICLIFEKRWCKKIQLNWRRWKLGAKEANQAKKCGGRQDGQSHIMSSRQPYRPQSTEKSQTTDFWQAFRPVDRSEMAVDNPRPRTGLCFLFGRIQVFFLVEFE